MTVVRRATAANDSSFSSGRVDLFWHEATFFLGRRGFFFVVLGVRVDLPGIELAEAHDVPGGEERGHHRVVLVVVLVHAVPAGQLEVAQVLEPVPDRRQMVLIDVVVDRIAWASTTQPS